MLGLAPAPPPLDQGLALEDRKVASPVEGMGVGKVDPGVIEVEFVMLLRSSSRNL